MLHSRASAGAVINGIMGQAHGVGESKTQAKENSSIRGQNGQTISTKNHSIKSEKNMRSVATKLVNHIKENYSGKVLGNITNENIKEYIRSEIERGVSLPTMNTEISALAKISDNLNQIRNDNQTTDRSEITSIRAEIKNEYGSMQSLKIDRSYENVDQIQENMRDTAYSISSDLQIEAGLRLSDAINVSQISINENGSLAIEQSKNGLNYNTAIVSEGLRERLQEAQQQNYAVSQSAYSEALKEAVSKVGEPYNGTHGLRYNHAQSSYQELRENGTDHHEALSQISLEMGHSREEITNHYLHLG